jgi:hypothetical protein
MVHMTELTTSSEQEAARAVLLVAQSLLRPVPPTYDWQDSSTIRLARKAAAEGKSILLKSERGSVLLSPKGFELWLSECRVDLPLSLSADSPSADESQHGVGCVLMVGPPGVEFTSEQEIDQSDALGKTMAAEFRRMRRAQENR